jgi:predicted amidohydrolase YtcJ
MQPSHAPSDRAGADAAWGDRAAGAYAWRSLADSGATLVFGSDAPIEPLRPLDGIHAAVNRTLDDRPPWRPEQALTVTEAVAGFTTGAAYAVGREHQLGRLGPGCYADLVVLDDDPFTCPPERISSIGVVATMVGGRWVHGRPPW